MNYDSLARGQPDGRVRTASAAERSIAFSPSMLSNPNRGWKHMPLSVIWLVTSFAIRLLVIHFRLVLLLTSRAKALAGIGRPRRARADETSSWLMKNFPPNGRPCGRFLPARIVAYG